MSELLTCVSPDWAVNVPPDSPQLGQVAPEQVGAAPPVVSSNMNGSGNTPPTAPVPNSQANPPGPRKTKLLITLIGLLFITCVVAAFFVGKHSERVIIRPPTAPPITLPPQAIVVAQCVPGLGKQYVIPKDIPNGPIYDVKNSKVIAVEYNYKAVELFLNPDRLSDTIIPLTKSYQIDHFTTTIGELKAGSLQEAQNVPIHLTIYVVTKAEAQRITCPNAK